MEQIIQIIDSKISNQLINSLRLVCGILILLIIVYLFPINSSASIIFSLILLLIFLFSAKSKIVVSNQSIIFETNRVFRILNSRLLIPFDEIEKLEYFPRKLNLIIFLLPGFGGFRNAEFIFKMKDNRYISREIWFNENRLNKLITTLDKKIKIINPSG